MPRYFYLHISLRISLIVFVSLLSGWLLKSQHQLYNAIALLLFVLFLVVNLIWYLNSVNRKIAYFFDAIQNEDFSHNFPPKTGNKLLDKLSSNMQLISQQIEAIHIENSRQEKYFEAMIEHINVGIMSINQEGFILNCNSTLKKLLGLTQFTHIRQLEKIDSQLASLTHKIEANHERTLTLHGKNGQVTLLVKASTLKHSAGRLKLVSMQDIREKLDEKELDSWLKLIRVLTHEIMNSIAPVTSLSENLCNQYVKNGNPLSTDMVDETLIRKTIQGLKVIQEQGKGLTRFVENYRKLTRLPKPEPQEVKIADLFEKTLVLFRSNLNGYNLHISTQLEAELPTLQVDEGQIMQVLQNLLRNAADALQHTPEPAITLTARREQGEIALSVRDNGPGIAPELLDEIFVPFFTTREDGNGIGLSLSRQLVRLNKGKITVRSEVNKGTHFTLLFK